MKALGKFAGNYDNAVFVNSNDTNKVRKMSYSKGDKRAESNAATLGAITGGATGIGAAHVSGGGAKSKIAAGLAGALFTAGAQKGTLNSVADSKFGITRVRATDKKTGKYKDVTMVDDTIPKANQKRATAVLDRLKAEKVSRESKK